MRIQSLSGSPYEFLGYAGFDLIPGREFHALLVLRQHNIDGVPESLRNPWTATTNDTARIQTAALCDNRDPLPNAFIGYLPPSS